MNEAVNSNTMQIPAREIFDIHGGVHPPENKTQSLNAPLRDAGIPAELILPLSQSIGAPAEPVVAVGDKVLKGQMIAKAAGFVSVPIHAPSSGTVTAIGDRAIPHTSGISGTCISIETDGEDRWIEHTGIADYTQLDGKELVTLIRDAGIAGMGGAGFPTAVKLSPPANKPISTLIINGTECEPYITADHVLMREHPEQIIEGAKILAHILKPEEILIGVEDNKPDAIEKLRAAALDSNIEVVVFPTKYPSGGEKQLIQILTGKEVPSGGLPADLGIVCQNIGTCNAIYNAVIKGEPLISRITTVTGNAVAEPGNLRALLGTPMQFLLDQCGFNAKKMQRLIMGGPMMGFTMPSTDVPIVKTSNCILVPTKDELPDPRLAQACIRCGMCAEACPVSLLPQQLYWFARGKELEKLESHHIADCIECGACSYVCPSNIPLVQYYRASKAAIRERNIDQQKADYSRERFEARQARLERMEAEKEARRKARAEKAAANKAAAAAGKSTPAADSKAAEVQAAIARVQAKKAETAAKSDDPVQAAIERAKAKRSGEDVPVDRATLEKNVASAEKRIKATESKLADARESNPDLAQTLESSLTKMQDKLKAAQSALAAFDAEQSKTPSAAPAASDDPVQAAIERAKAKRAGGGDAAPDQASLEKALASAAKRLQATESKLAEARDGNPDLATTLETSLAKMQDKHAQAQKALDDFLAANAPNEQTDNSDDPVAAAIERAKAKRAAGPEDVSEESLQKAVDAARKRLLTTQEKVAAAKEDNPDLAATLETSLAKMQQKVEKAEADLAQFKAEQS
jgi:electron transport complex protein RnfC